jgi:molybdate transport system substrate-binding protein
MTPLKIFSTNAMRSVMSELVATFERASGQVVSIGWSTTNQTLSRIRAGETADVVIATGPGIDELTKLGKTVPGSRAELGTTLIGIGVRAGAPRPDISSVQAFKSALLAAESITYTTLGQSGVHFEQVVARLGITEQLQPKFKVIPGGLVGELVVRGEAELGVQMLPEILAVKGFELVGPFPPELQQVNSFAAAMLAGTQRAEAAKAFIEFLTTPAAMAAMEAGGFSPR